MPPTDRAELLSRTPLFGGLAEPERRALGTEMRDVSYSAGQVIFTRGDAGRDIYLVTEGRVRLSILTAEGRELSFAHAGPGQIFGEIAMLDGGTRSADATAVQRTAALTLSRGALLRVMQDRPVVGEAMLRFLCGRIREADQQLEAIALYPIEGRLARFFLAAAQQKGGEPRQGRLTIDFDMSQSELALLIGASRPKVNTALSLLEAGGALTRKGGRIECDLAELRQIAGLE